MILIKDDRQRLAVLPRRNDEDIGRPDRQKVAEAIAFAMQYFDISGCADRMEFGDHPEAAAERMRWIRRSGATIINATVLHNTTYGVNVRMTALMCAVFVLVA